MNWMTSGRKRVQRSLKTRELRAKHFAKVTAERFRPHQQHIVAQGNRLCQSSDVSFLKSKWTTAQLRSKSSTDEVNAVPQGPCPAPRNNNARNNITGVLQTPSPYGVVGDAHSNNKVGTDDLTSPPSNRQAKLDSIGGTLTLELTPPFSAGIMGVGESLEEVRPATCSSTLVDAEGAAWDDFTHPQSLVKAQKDEQQVKGKGCRAVFMVRDIGSPTGRTTKEPVQGSGSGDCEGICSVSGVGSEEREQDIKDMEESCATCKIDSNLIANEHHGIRFFDAGREVDASGVPINMPPHSSCGTRSHSSQHQDHVKINGKTPDGLDISLTSINDIPYHHNSMIKVLGEGSALGLQIESEKGHKQIVSPLRHLPPEVRLLCDPGDVGGTLGRLYEMMDRATVDPNICMDLARAAREYEARRRASSSELTGFIKGGEHNSVSQGDNTSQTDTQVIEYCPGTVPSRSMTATEVDTLGKGRVAGEVQSGGNSDHLLTNSTLISMTIGWNLFDGALENVPSCPLPGTNTQSTYTTTEKLQSPPQDCTKLSVSRPFQHPFCATTTTTPPSQQIQYTHLPHVPLPPSPSSRISSPELDMQWWKEDEGEAKHQVNKLTGHKPATDPTPPKLGPLRNSPELAVSSPGLRSPPQEYVQDGFVKIRAPAQTPPDLSQSNRHHHFNKNCSTSSCNDISSELTVAGGGGDEGVTMTTPDGEGFGKELSLKVSRGSKSRSIQANSKDLSARKREDALPKEHLSTPLSRQTQKGRRTSSLGIKILPAQKREDAPAKELLTTPHSRDTQNGRRTLSLGIKVAWVPSSEKRGGADNKKQHSVPVVSERWKRRRILCSLALASRRSLAGEELVDPYSSSNTKGDIILNQDITKEECAAQSLESRDRDIYSMVVWYRTIALCLAAVDSRMEGPQ